MSPVTQSTASGRLDQETTLERVLGLTLAFSIFFVPGLVQAQSLKSMCSVEIEKFCGGVQLGGGRIGECLLSREAELSEKCRSAMNDSFERIKACAEDREKFCGDVKPGGGRPRVCMSLHQDKLSAECKAALIRAGII